MIRVVPLLPSLLLLAAVSLEAQTDGLEGRVRDIDGNPVVGATVRANGDEAFALTNADGDFRLPGLWSGTVEVVVRAIGYQTLATEHRVGEPGEGGLLLSLQPEAIALEEVLASASRLPGAAHTAPDILGTMVLAGTKTTIVETASLPANLAEKTGRQIFSRVPGAFVYDMDGSGNQVNVSTRGLDAHRSWELNVRQDGVLPNSDMYGYPASHYSPPMEAIASIEMVRGTAALQYGSQFGGLVNYVTKSPEPPRCPA